MSATLEPSSSDGTHNRSDEEFDEALRKLQSEEEQLETRTRRLEFSGPLGLTFSFLALVLALGALIVAVTKDNSGSTAVASAGSSTGRSGQGVSTPASGTTKNAVMSNGMMMGAGGHGSFTKAQVDASNTGTVYVQLGDFWVAPTVDAIRAGKITFRAKNTGMAPHELMIERAPIKLESPGKPDEMAAQGMINDMKTGQTGQLTITLKPGNYVLFCNVSGHYVAGQHIPFTVTAD